MASTTLNQHQLAAVGVGGGLAAVVGCPGCIAEGTVLRYNRGKRTGGRYITIEEFYKKFNGIGSRHRPWVDLSKPTYLQSRTASGEVRYNQVLAVVDSGVKRCIRIITEDGASIACTQDHRFMLPDGSFTRAGKLKVGDSVLRLGTMKPVANGGKKPVYGRRTTTVRYHPYGCMKVKFGKYVYKELPLARLIVEASMNSISLRAYLRALKKDLPEARNFVFLDPNLEVHHKNGDHTDDRLENYEILSKEVHARLHGAYENFRIDWAKPAKIVEILDVGKLPTYDITMKAPDHNFAANDFLVHNSGKTRVILERIVRLVRDGYPAGAILAVTFTKNAAAELGDRLARRGIIAVKVSTIHALLHELLTETVMGYAAMKIDGSGFALEHDITRLIPELRKKGIVGDRVRIGEALRYISHCKNSGPCFIAGDPWGENAAGKEYMRSVARKFAAAPGVTLGSDQLFRISWELELKRASADRATYDDMIQWGWSLLATRQDVIDKVRARWGLVIMDEAQDSTALQWDVVRLIAGLPSDVLPGRIKQKEGIPNLMIAGDISQSIYAWRSAEPDIMLDFCTAEGVGVYPLPVNYRSTASICDVATKLVIAHPWHLSGEMLPARGIPGESIKFFRAASAIQEAQLVIEACQGLAAQRGGSYAGIAVLSRLARFLGFVELECIRHGIPYVKRASSGLFETREVLALLAYLRVACGHDTTGKYGRQMVCAPFRFIGKAALDEADVIMKRKGGTSYLDCLKLVGGLSQKQQRSIWALGRLVQEITTMVRNGSMRPGELMRYVMEEVDYKGYLFENRNDMTVDEGLLSVIDEIIDVADRFDTVPEFLSFFDQAAQGVRMNRKDLQVKEGEGPQRNDVLILSTIHRAKGLEFSDVFIGDVNPGHFPASFCHSLEEELRLMYVAITRGKDSVTLSYVDPTLMRPIPIGPDGDPGEVKPEMLKDLLSPLLMDTAGRCGIQPYQLVCTSAELPTFAFDEDEDSEDGRSYAV